MSSYGEAEITVNARLVGKMRLLSIYPASAVYPRLGIGLGCTLHDDPTAEFAKGRPIEAFELRELAGELRLTEKGDTIGPIVWAGPRRYVRSSSYGSENQLDLMCDLDALRLEGIEEHRDGGEPVLWLVLWPTLADQHGFLDAGLHPIQVRIPCDQWIDFVAAVRDQRFSILEAVFSAADAARFEAAVKHVREARSRIDGGDYDEAVGACRRGLEALAHELGVKGKVDDLRPLLEAGSNTDRAKEYGKIISSVKQLAGFAIHDFGRSTTYSRVEAGFVVNTTENLLVLIGALASRK